MNAGKHARRNRLVFLVLWGIAGLYAFQNLDRGWIPHDEGTLAQSAERVLRGDLPHRDFDEVYTGGLSVLNAVAFRVLGVNLLTPRLVLFGFFLAWVPAVFYVTTRFAAWPMAALATLLSVAWSIPNYPAAMPSWYNLFFAVFGLAAFLGHLETGARRWLFWAGLAGGCSILVKTSGTFFVAAGLLFVAYREQETAEAEASRANRDPASRHRVFSTFSTLLLLTFLVLLTRLVGGRSGGAGILRFVVPLGALALFLAWSEWRGGARGGDAARFRNLARLALPFLGGVLGPLAVLAGIYLALGAEGDLARGLFQAPTARLAYAATPPPGLGKLWVVLPLLALVLLDVSPWRRARASAAAFVVLAATALLVARPPDALFPPLWYLLNALGPLVAVSGVMALVVLQRRRGADANRRQRLLAAVSVAGGVMLIQFPFAGAIYLFYALPALVPAALALVDGGPKGSSQRPVFAGTMVFLVVFSARWINSGTLFADGRFPYDPASATARLALPRGGNLRVESADKEQYERLVAAMQGLSGSPFTFAAPDLPEVYFLSGLRNPTPTLFDFFAPAEGRTGRILEALEARDVDVIVLNRRLRFSGPPPDDLLEELQVRYPRAAIIGDFILRWREARGTPSPAGP